MPLVKRFENLEVWQEARKLTQMIYELSEDGTFHRDYGLSDQIRRACVSVMNNVVEGFDSSSTAEFIKFLGYAKRSSSEVQSCLYVALDRRYFSPSEFQKAHDKVEHVRNLITGFIRYLRYGRTSSTAPTGTQAPRHPGT